MEEYFDSTYIWESIPALLPYLKMTFFVAGLSVLFGSLLGLILAIMKLGENKVFQNIAHGYTTVLRCTPSIVLLFLIYYGVPAIAMNFGVNLNDMSSVFFVVITFTLQFGALMSEVIRSAYESIDRGQYEAAVSVGLSNMQAYRRIIFPQAFVVALPNFGNALLELMKEGALAYTIGLIDVMGKANLIIASNYNSHALEIYIGLSIIYWVLSIIIEQFFLKLERVFSKGNKGLKAA
ncbi:amino acid ABC transporter permease [Oceanobacillus piezotolerans]|uniref:Amino acid ABC transporter permease n=1 Tax=Oceanobacillus piezotolerans TaxID=2448030 RepID=A0A498D7Y1_9BACI|nr:amino acid ABC transporter permease [Oceanobacillus piezotolerans]RLL43898.1 amino acid ABC transporter permease [Oceanobacillus piezotolerans]